MLRGPTLLLRYFVTPAIPVHDCNFYQRQLRAGKSIILAGARRYEANNLIRTEQQHILVSNRIQGNG